MNEIINILQNNGFQIYLVGGAVRDMLCKISPSDWDLATNAPPQTIIKLLSAINIKTVHTAIQHGTVTAVLNNIYYQITTFRNEGPYSDHRRPDYVTYSNSIYQDLSRRDFTINAMAYDCQKQLLIDPFNGKTDLLDNRLIRAVGNPLERFTQDSLRILRAIRFAARFGFKIEPQAESAMFKTVSYLDNLSVERIQKEFSGIITVPSPDNVINRYLPILKHVIPEIPYPTPSLDKQTSTDLVQRLNTLFRDTSVLSRLHYPKKILSDFSSLTAPPPPPKLAITGSDLISIGFSEGPVIGQALRILQAKVVNKQLLNTHDTLLKEAVNILRNNKRGY